LPDRETLVIRRPAKYFTNKKVFPETVTLRIAPIVTRPQSSANLSQRVVAAVKNAVERARNAVLAAGRRFLGRKAVLRQSFQAKAESFEPKRGPIPQVRARNWALLRAILAAHAGFRASYREALEAWRDGDRSVVFPCGTWAMRLMHGAAVAAASG